MQIEPWFLGPVPTYRVNKQKDRRCIRHQPEGGSEENRRGGETMHKQVVKKH
jgi:hypothetical protein